MFLMGKSYCSARLAAVGGDLRDGSVATRRAMDCTGGNGERAAGAHRRRRNWARAAS
jgi:hypothetical protein